MTRETSCPGALGPAHLLPGRAEEPELWGAVPLLQDLLAEAAARLPDKVALVAGERRLTYAEVDRRSNALAHALVDGGVARGDRVFIYGANAVEVAVAFWAALKASAVVTLVHPQTKAAKLAYLLGDCEPGAVIADGALRRRLAGPVAAAPSVRATVLWGPERDPAEPALPGEVAWGAAIGQGRDAPPPRRAIDDDLAAILYTSGSTGEPKGVMQTHRSMRAAAISVAAYLRHTEDDVLLVALPLSFDYGLYQLIMAALVGARVVVERSWAYPAKVLAVMVREGVTTLPGVPTVFAVLAEMEGLDRFDLGALRRITNTAAALPVKHIASLRQRFPDAALYSMYGLTECQRVSFLPPRDLDRKPRSVGRPIPDTEVWIVDDEGKLLGPGQAGQLVVRGATVMRGYWRKPEASGRRLAPGPLPGEHVLMTGDRCVLDEEGYITFLGRSDQVLKCGGEKVAPREVEAALAEIPGVSEVVVVGVDDAVLGQAVRAIIVPEAGAELHPRQIKRQARELLEDFMVPKEVVFVGSLPRTSSGKVDTRRLVNASRGPAPERD